MSRRDRRKSGEKADRSQRMNHLKAMALKNVAKQAWGNNQRYKTIALLTEALRREPANPEILLELATAYGKQRYYQRANDLLERLITLAPRSASIYRRVGQTYSLIDRPERAIEYLTRSLELNRETAATVETQLDLAGLYERSHKLAEAQQMVTEALRQEPDNERGRLLRATLEHRVGNVSSAESGLRELLKSETCHITTRAQAGYELAQLCDEQGQYDSAFEALKAAKHLLRPHAKGFLQLNQETLHKNQELLSDLDKSVYDRWVEKAAEDTAYRIAVLTGHPRSGTTLIEQVLDSHDRVKSADEFDVFSQWVHQPIFRRFPPTLSIVTVLDHVPGAVRQQARTTYWQQTEAILDQPLGECLLLDKNPGMTILLPVVNWAFPEMKILFALRDPRDVVLSCFMQKVPLTPISSSWLSLEDTAEYYARNMATWLKTRELTPSPWLEFKYEDVVSDLEKAARRILAFLGLDWDEKVLHFFEHAKEKIVRSPTYKDVTKPVYSHSLGRWQHYAAHLEPVLSHLKPFLEAFGYE
jgi:tetratricopeptide (TPR) repeat protein